MSFPTAYPWAYVSAFLFPFPIPSSLPPSLQEDYRKIMVERKGEKNFFTSQMIKDCMRKVITVNLHQSVQVNGDLEIKAYYAGHVLGAAMFQVKVGEQSIVYTVTEVACIDCELYQLKNK